ncbi:MAG: hypothetical protein L0211_05730 [Planctomycetaceae bacterium]|nr:hypothetical protein [Planctomycetaceae bacterium]
MKHRAATVLIVLLAGLLWADDKPKPAIDPAAQKQLEKIQQLVGQWKGVGQPQRGSTKDSWVEEADWAWSFEKGVALVGKQPKGKYFSAIKLVRGQQDGEYELIATATGGGEELRYTGKLDDDGKLLLVAAEPREGLPARISIRFVADGDRLLVLLERKGNADQYVRLAEVGYTRQGSGFGKGSSGPECVVTGGAGTIEVMHNGVKYYVCCTGCLEYFKENPDEIIAEYKIRKEEEKKQRQAKP